MPLLLILSMLSFKNCDLTVTVTNIASAKGKIYVAIYDKKEKFMNEDYAVFSQYTNAVKGSVQIKFSNVPVGNYAVAVFHDSNDNKKLDKNFLGIPTEYYGFSNNARGSFGPPTFEQCTFSIQGNMEISIKLK